MGVFFGRAAVGVFGPGQVSLFDVQVAQPKQNLRLGLAVAKRIEQKGDSFGVAASAPQLLGLGERGRDELAALTRGQARGVGQSSAIRSFTV